MLVGLVGRPNSGKSTFFKAATLADVEIAAYPFAFTELLNIAEGRRIF